MIVGIDDSGNFGDDPLSFYAAVFIRPRRYARIKEKFLLWENQVPDSAKENGEVKGKLLSEDQLIEFADIILTNNGYGAIKAQVFGIEINKTNTDALLNQRSRNVAQMREQSEETYRAKGREFNQIASFYEQMADWLESKSLKTLFKIELLGIGIVKALNLAIISSTLRGFDKELGKLEINIDQGITGRASVDNYWRDTMRMIIWNITSSIEPIIHISEWRPNHPFIKRFYRYPEDQESLVMLTKEMRNLSQFYDSKDRYEIRIADIVASAYYRKYVKKEAINEAIRLMARQRIEFGQPYIKIGLSNTENPNPINPYIDRVNGVTAEEIKKRHDGD